MGTPLWAIALITVLLVAATLVMGYIIVRSIRRFLVNRRIGRLE